MLELKKYLPNLPNDELSILEDTMYRGKLRATRPKNAPGKSQYVWRWLVFYLSDKREHLCIPISADFYLDLPYEETKLVKKELDALVDKILDAIPVAEQRGLNRWTEALF